MEAKLTYLVLSNFWNLKVGLSPSKKNFLFALMIAPSKMIKNAFYFVLKALFVLKIFKFFFWLFERVEKTAWLEK